MQNTAPVGEPGNDEFKYIHAEPPSARGSTFESFSSVTTMTPTSRCAYVPVDFFAATRSRSQPNTERPSRSGEAARSPAM